jgi:hypothetical protein
MEVYANHYCMSLDDAQQLGLHLVVQDDADDTIYFTVPVEQMGCNEQELAVIIDQVQQKLSNCAGITIYEAKKYATGEQNIGPNDCGVLTNSLWIHPTMEKLRDKISSILTKKEKDSNLPAQL